MENWEVSAYLIKIAQLMALRGESQYRVQAYQNAARVILHLNHRVKELAEQDRLSELKGIGKALSINIKELVQEGQNSHLHELEKEVPEDLLALLNLPGIGLKTATRLVQHLRPANLKEVKWAAQEGKVRNLPGLGASVEKKLLENLKLEEKYGKILHQGIALPLAESFLRRLYEAEVIHWGYLGGELRRGVDSITEAVLVVNPRINLTDLAAFFSASRGVKKVKPLQGQGQGLFLTTFLGVPVIIYAAEVGSFWTTLLYYTGSKRHIRGLEEQANSCKLELGREGLYRNKSKLPLKREQDIYTSLQLEYVPPELREGEGEIERAREESLPSLVNLEEVRGDLHLHTDWSDGYNTLEQLAEEAVRRNYSYIAITDHSVSLRVANGLTREELEQQVEAILKLRNKFSSIEIFAGVEVDILSDGKLDYPDEVLAQLDLVIASIHSGLSQSREQITSRLEAAIENPWVHIIGHPTGRLIGQRGSYDLDLERFFSASARCGKVLEINASPDRLDLPYFYLQEAKKWGLKFSIGTDAHGLGSFDDLRLGVTTARKGWLQKEDVINTYPREELKKLLQR